MCGQRPGVAGREHAGELDDPVVARRLDAAQVVLVLDALRVHRIAPGLVAVPGVDRGARIRLARVRQIEDGEPDRERDAGRDRRARAECRRDVLAHDAALVEHVRTVRAIARVGTGGLLRDLGRAVGGGRGRRARRGGRRRARGRAGSRRAGRDPEADPGEADALEHAAPVHQGLDVECQALVPRRLGGVGERPTLERRRGVGGAAGRGRHGVSGGPPPGLTGRCCQHAGQSLRLDDSARQDDERVHRRATIAERPELPQRTRCGLGRRKARPSG